MSTETGAWNGEGDPFAGMNEAKRPQIKMGKVGDWFLGTLTDNTREIENQLSAKHEMQTICEFKIHGGSFHDIVNKVASEEATVLKAGEFMSFFAKGMVRDQLKKAPIGTKIGVRFAEIKPSTKPGFNDTKIIKVFLGEMDPEYQGEQGKDVA